MIGTEFIKGQGLGNQLFAYVTARAVAKERGVPFGTAGRENFANNIHSSRGMYFMDVDLGEEIAPEKAALMNRFDDADDRIYTGNSNHDLEHGVYVSGAKQSIHEVADDTLLFGNLQDESYFSKYRDELSDWLRVKPEADSHEYTSDDLCILNLRGGEYADDPALFLPRSYWKNAMKKMRELNPGMRFMVVTEDESAAKRVLPELECHHFDMGKDYVTLKNARYLILSNSSFAVMAAMTSSELKSAIAPKYWARYNVSDGYWASEQNIYSIFRYMDRSGRLMPAEECRRELEEYKRSSKLYASTGVKPAGAALTIQKLRAASRRCGFYAGRAAHSLARRAGVYGR